MSLLLLSLLNDGTGDGDRLQRLREWVLEGGLESSILQHFCEVSLVHAIERLGPGMHSSSLSSSSSSSSLSCLSFHFLLLDFFSSFLNFGQEAKILISMPSTSVMSMIW